MARRLAEHASTKSQKGVVKFVEERPVMQTKGDGPPQHPKGGANGIALAALRTAAGGPSTLYRVDLASGAATLAAGTTSPALSVVGSGLALRDIAISLR